MADTVRIEIAVEATDNTGRALEGVVQNLQALARETRNAQGGLSRASEQVSQFDRQANRANKTLQNWVKQKWQVAIEAVDKVSPVLSAVKGVLSNLAGSAWNVTLKAFDFVTAPVRGILNLLKNPLLQAGAVLGVSIGLKDTIDTFKNFESAMSQVGAVSGASGAEFEKLTAKAQEMGATTKFTATEAAEAMNYMAMAGWKTNDMMNGIEGIMNLAAASGEDLATTSDIVTDALTAFGLKAQDSGHFADVLAAASSNANTNVGMMGETFKYAASIFGSLYGEGERAEKGMEDAALAIGLMANAGIKGTQAGTSLRSIMTRLSTDAGATKNSLGALGVLTERLGVQFYNADHTVRNFEDILLDTREAWAKLNAEEQTSYAKTIAGQEAMTGWLAMMNAAPADLEKLTEAIHHADGAAERMKEEMLDNLQGSLTLLQSAADGVKLSLGSRLAPYLRSFADKLTASMPAIQKGVEDFMDWFDGKVDQFKERYREAVNTEGFADSDIFGKIHILWDKIIGEPFSEWWNSAGKQMFADAAGDVGKGIGAGIKNGILALLGIDLGEAQDAGASIAGSFISGFKSGFDSKTMSGVIKTALGGMVSSAAKILPGGQAPGLDTAVSALALSKIAAPVLAVGKGAATIGKSVFAPSASGGASLGASVLGTAASGTGLLGFGSNAAITLGAGNLAGGASLSTGALSTLGLGSIAGGIVGGISAGSGALDWYRSSQTEDQQEKEALQSSGNWKLGGAAAGAAAGMAIGSVVPVIGTAVGGLIGAGIGGAVGMYQGNKRKKDYEEQAQAARDAAEAEAAAHELIQAKAEYTGQSLQTVTFKSQELNEAFHDSEVTVERFGAMFREAVNEKITSSFGNITLSLQEIKDLADSITFDGMAGEAEKFENAVAQSNKALSNVKADSASLEKLNWKASLGFNFSETDLSDYRAQVDSFVKNAQSYVTDKHYEASVALKLITGGTGDTTGLDSAYDSIRGELEARSAELQAAVQKALEDGVISTEPVTLPDGTVQLSEYAEITNLQNQISDIMNQVSAAEESAQLDTLKIKYGGANLDAASFQQLQTELAANIADMTTTYDKALRVSLTNLHLQLDQGAISREEFQAQVDALTESYHLQISDMNLRVESFQLDTIAEAFHADLEGILPSLTGDVSERLKQAMNAALAVEPDPVQWTQEQVTQWFGLEGLDAETQAAVGGMLQNVAATIPQTIRASLSEQMGGADLTNIISDVTMDTSGVTEALNSDVMDAVDAVDLSGASDALGEKVVNEFSNVDLTAATDALNNGVVETISSADYSAITEAIDGNVAEAAANVDFTAATEAITGNAAEAMAGLDFTEGAGVLKTGLESSVTEAISAPDISAAKESLRTALSSGITEAINSVDLSAAYAALTALRQALETRAQATLGAQMTIQIPVNLTYNYNVTNPTPPKPTVTAQALTMNTTAHADGGFVNGAELSWVGEDGPEAIIPLGAKRRGRGLELYEQVGEILGVAKNAEGGIYNSRSYVSTSSYTGGTRNAQYIQRTGAVYDNRETQTDISHVLQSNPISYVGNTLNSSALSYGNAYSAGDTLNSSALSYGNAYSAGDTLNRSALSYGNAYTAGDSYTELSQAGQGSYYADTLPMLSPERATAYDAQEGTGAAFEAGVGQYPATTAESDREDARGQDGAFPPLSDDTDQDTEGDGGGGFSGTVNNQPTVIIHVNVNPHFQIDGSGGQSASELEAMVRRCIKEMTDDIGGELAERLIPVFQNMPMGGAG